MKDSFSTAIFDHVGGASNVENARGAPVTVGTNGTLTLSTLTALVLTIDSGPADVGGNADRSVCGDSGSSGALGNGWSLALAASDSRADSFAADAASSAAASATSGESEATKGGAALVRLTEDRSIVRGAFMRWSSSPPPQADRAPATKKQKPRLIAVEYLQCEFMVVISLRAKAIFKVLA